MEVTNCPAVLCAVVKLKCVPQPKNVTQTFPVCVDYFVLLIMLIIKIWACFSEVHYRC